MMFRILAALLASVALHATAGPPAWRPVPGAPEVEVDLAGSRVHAGTLTAWVRLASGPGAPIALQRLAVQAAGPLPPHHRTAMLVQVDCRRQGLRVEAVQAYSAAGTAVFMSSTPGPRLRLPDEAAAGWVYDALCEWMRAGS